MNFRDQLLNQQLLKDANNQLHNVLLLHNQTEYVGDPLDLAPGVLATIVFLRVKPGQVSTAPPQTVSTSFLDVPVMVVQHPDQNCLQGSHGH